METLPQPVAPQGATAVTVPRQANHDGELISMWLHGRPATTRRVYERHVGNFLRLVGQPLGTVTVPWADRRRTRHRRQKRSENPAAPTLMSGERSRR